MAHLFNNSRTKGTDSVGRINLNPPMVAAVDSVVAVASPVWEERGVGSLSHNVIFGVLFSFANFILIRRELNTLLYTTLTNLSTKYLVMCKVYTDVEGV